MADRLYFRQLLAGIDFAADDMVAQQMVNFVYLVGDRETGEAVAIDAAYDIGAILDVLAEDDMRLVGALASHYHADHVGGTLMGHIEGLPELLERTQVPIHVQADEAPWVQKSTGLTESELVTHQSSDIVKVGEVEIELIHTPGHTPGSQCFLVDDKKLVSGDTLFLQGCGRTDLPGGDPEQLYESLTTKLAHVPDDAVLYPGHLYSPEPSQTMAKTRAGNLVFRPTSLENWLMMFS